MTDAVLERLGELEEAVRRAAETLARLRLENEGLRRDVARLTDERRQVLGQIDGILTEIGKLEID
jgi:FtsZ-binding cell division protein ZapB